MQYGWLLTFWNPEKEEDEEQDYKQMPWEQHTRWHSWRRQGHSNGGGLWRLVKKKKPTVLPAGARRSCRNRYPINSSPSPRVSPKLFTSNVNNNNIYSDSKPTDVAPSSKPHTFTYIYSYTIAAALWKILPPNAITYYRMYAMRREKNVQ